MTTLTAAEPRLAILPTGVRIVRLEAGEAGWLVEYDRILRVAAADFLRRARLPGNPEGVLARLRAAVDDPRQAVWLILDPAYRLIGFSLMELSSPYGGPLVAVTHVAYLYPRKRAPHLLPELARRMSAWARAQGATHHYFETRRKRSRAWARVGARPASVFYEVDMEAPHG